MNRVINIITYKKTQLTFKLSFITLLILLLSFMNFINIEKGWGMEEAKNSLVSALDSIQESFDNKTKIEVQQIKNYLDSSKNFLIEYFKGQKFINLFFENNDYNIYEDLKTQVENIRGNNVILKTIISNIASISKLKRANYLNRYTINTAINAVFGGVVYSSLINNILNKGIYNKDIAFDNDTKQVNDISNIKTASFSFIRESADIDIFLNNINFNETKYIGNIPINERETIIKNLSLTKLNEKISKVFLNSKRLLFQQTVQQLLTDIYDIDMFTVQNLYIDDMNEDIDISEYDRYITFDHNNQTHTIQQKKKIDGVNAGFILEMYQEDELINKFFIKKYHKGGFCIKNNHYTGKSLGTNISSATITSFYASQSQSDTKSTTNHVQSNNVTFLNLKEPFMYKVLEELNIGPKTHFIINPYVNNGFYIATKDIVFGENNLIDDRYFALMHGFTNKGFISKNDKTHKKNNLDNKEEININFTEELNENNGINFFIGLSELNLFGLMSSLEDLNLGNYGYIFTDINQSQNTVEIEAINKNNFKIIDFGPSFYREDKKDRISFNKEYKFKDDMQNILGKFYGIKFDETCFFEGFSKRLTNINILEKALSQFEERLKTYKENHQHLFQEEQQNNNISNEAILTKLLKTEAQSIKDLMRVHRNDLPILNNRTNAELIGFKTGEAPNDLVEPKERLQYLDNAFEDLDIYCQGVVQNYKTLKKFIEDGYNEYFDGEGNLRQ